MFSAYRWLDCGALYKARKEGNDDIRGLPDLTDEEYLQRAVRMTYIGVTEESFEYMNLDGKTYKGKFEFYWNVSSGAIDVCHAGCNGPRFTGRVNQDGSVVFYSIPYGYPEETVFTEEFRKLQEKFFAK